MLTFGSLFAGIEGFGAGLEQSGMRCVFQVEIDPQCRSVLERHWPTVPRWNDVRDFDGTTTAIRPDWLTGGFPCQDLSVAGRRAGLAGERSGLWHEFRRVIAAFRPRGVLIENVPGLLSSNGGRDMGIVLGGLGQLGYGYCYRVLDAQWFGVAQRRRRVFIVGHLGGVRRAAEILFERESLPWDSPPSRAARARIAASLTAGVSSGSGINRPGRRREDDVNLVSHALSACKTATGRLDPNGETLIPYRVHSERSCAMQGNGDANMADPCDVARNLDSNGGWSLGQGGNIVAHTLRAEGHDASEDGTGRGVPLVAYQCQGSNVGPMGTLKGHNETAGVPFVLHGSDDCQRTASQTDIAQSLRCRPPGSIENSSTTAVLNRSGVRRLTPRECERLQGFPDDWTRYAADGTEISDSARYRMLGNAVNKKVSAWIGRRIVEATHHHPAAPAAAGKQET